MAATPETSWEPTESLPPGEGMRLSLEGFDGPIDLLLALAREQKVDLARLSILALAEQYLDFIATARKLRLELAADYLVMAAWLAYLKSRLLLPETPQDEPPPAALAEALKFQLQRLEAMQKMAQRLHDLPRLGSGIYARGEPEAPVIEERPVYYLPLQDLMAALAAPHRRRKPPAYQIAAQRLYSLEESLLRLRRLMGHAPDWSDLQAFLPSLDGAADETGALEARSALASAFAATLEMVKAGELELRQDGVFAPLWLRRRDPLSSLGDET